MARVSLCWVAGLVFWSLSSQAAELFQTEPPFISLGAGMVEVFDDHPKGGLFIEYRPAFRLWNAGPWLFLGHGPDQALYAGGGLLLNLHLGSHWILTPSFGVGYFKPSEILDLGHELEFRSSLECAYQFNNGHRAGLCLGHLSNGGIAERNPGTEWLMLVYSIPLHFNAHTP